MVKLVNRAYMTTATTGAGLLTLGAAVASFRSFAASGVVDGDVVRYVIEDGENWEIGSGTYTATGTTLTRAVEDSSNGGAAITLSGTAVVFVTAVAADFGGGDSLGTVTGADLDLSAGNFFEVTTDDQTLTFSNPPNVHDFKIKLTGAGTVTGYDLNVARFDSFRVGSQESSPSGVAFNTDGTKMFITGYTSDSVYQYTLTTGFDVSTASYDLINFSVSAQETSPTGVAFSTDGTKMFIIGDSSDRVHQYTLTIGFDVSTASYESVNVLGPEGSPQAVTFNIDGTKMFIVGNSSDAVHQYTLTTGFSLSTASYDGVSFSVAAQASIPTGLTFNTDGTKMFIMDNSTDSVYQYTLTIGFDVSTASYDNLSFNVAAQDSVSFDLKFNSDGTKMFIVGNGSDAVQQYTLTTGFDVSTATFNSKSIKVGSQEASPSGVAFSTDGTKMFIVGGSSDAVHQYTLTTGFDVSTASYGSVSFSVAAQDANPSDLKFSPDGTKMFIIGSTSDSVHQYTLTTGFDVSTASYGSVSFSVVAQESAPTGLAFNPDGTKMFITGSFIRQVHQYTLTTGFDVSTASYDSVSLDVSVQDAATQGVDFTADGTKMFMVGSVTDSVHQYTLTTAFDVATASYDNVSFSVAGQETTPQGFAFSPDGQSMLVCGNGTDTVYQYPTVSFTTAVITYPASVKFSGATPPTAPAIGEVDTLGVYTVDGGTTFYAYQLGDNHA